MTAFMFNPTFTENRRLSQIGRHLTATKLPQLLLNLGQSLFPLKHLNAAVGVLFELGFIEIKIIR
jgi:hypothetical protein